MTHHPATCVTCHGTGKVEAPPGHFMRGIVYRCEDCEWVGPVARKIGKIPEKAQPGSGGEGGE